MSMLKRILHSLRPYRLQVALSLLLSVGNVVLTLLVPLLIGQAIDCAVGIGQVDFGSLSPLLVKIGLCAAGAALLQWLCNTVNNTLCFRAVQDLRSEAFHRLSDLPLSYLDTHPAGDLVSRILSDADIFSDGLLMGFSRLFNGVATILGTLVLMVSRSVVIAAVVVLLTPVSLFVAKFIADRTYALFRSQSEAKAQQTALIDETVGGHFTVKALSMEEQNRANFAAVNGRLRDVSLKATFFSSLTNPCTRFANSTVYAGVALAGGLSCIATAGTAAPFTVGMLSSLLAYANQYTKPFNEISGVITELQNAFACASRLFELIDAPGETPDAADALSPEKVTGDVTLQDVSFSYVPSRPLISGLSLSVPAGKRVAIVGPTGCGKTTLINLLMRFYDVNSGCITVDGTDIRRLTRDSLRRQYGMVLQDTWILSGTVAENIALGRPDATKEDIVAAAKAAHADGFIRRLPRGYDTLLTGETGLSQGQKQLLCISRVMLCLPPMLILDEATSSIDTRTEQKIQDAFARLMEGRTAFLVAHRLSTVKNADLILVMKDGNVVEQGTHASLMAKGGFYATLYQSGAGSEAVS